MKKAFLSLLASISVLSSLMLFNLDSARGQWTKVNSAPNASTCLLLTDGSVMCQNGEQSKSWRRLTPDQNGQYATGTWTNLADLPQPNPVPPGYGPLYYASGVLANGKVFVIGGEYNNGYLGCATPTPNNCPTTTGYIFDPVANSWAGPIAVPAGYGGSDNQSIVMQDGTVLIADVNSGNIYQLDPVALTLTLVNATGKLDGNDEEGWVGLPNGSFLTVDANNTANVSSGGGTAWEIYDPTTKNWTSPGYTPVNLVDINSAGKGSSEVGPAVLRPDGTLIHFGGNPSGQTATYSLTTQGWTQAATFPLNSSNKQLTVADGPAAALPGGNVLVEASPGVVGGVFGTGGQFFEFTLGGVLNDVTAGGPSVSSEAAYKGRMVLLPTGDVLYTHGSGDVYLYNNGATPQDPWRPFLISSPNVLGLGVTYPISGWQFNGVTMGGSYGDDAQTATNYPLVRITNNATHHVFYARTHDHSRMGVEAVGDPAIVTTNFDVSPGTELGPSTLVVIANGIPSLPLGVTVEPASALAFAAGSATSSDFNDPAVVSAVLTGSAVPLAGKTVTFVLGAGAGAPTCSGVTDGTGFASCSITPNQAAGPQTLTATFASDASFAGSSATSGFTVTHEESAVAFTLASGTTADFDDAVQLQAQLTTDGVPLASRNVVFVLGSGGSAPTCSAVTDGSGNATCSLTPNQAAGTVSLSASFAGDAYYVSSSATTSFTVTKEQDTLQFTASSATVIANGHPANLQAKLLEDGVTAIAGRTVTFTLGSGGSAQACTGTTDGTGTASCSLIANQPVLGPLTVTANFAGDGYYLPSTVSEPVIVFAFLNSGSMIVGNLNAGTGNAVEYWGASWATVNTPSGGPAPNAFKGFASAAPQACVGGWTSGTGNSPGPPSGVPSYMGVIASSMVGQAGSIISGSAPMIVVVRTDPGYGPSPGHAGTGTVVAVYCHP